MKRKTTFSALTLITLSALLMFSCTGSRGPQGLTGPAGNDGADGNANVRTVVYDIEPQHWLQDDGEENIWYDAYDISLITDNIVDYGTVLVYLKSVTGDDYWTAMPITNVLSDESGSIWTEQYDAWYTYGTLIVDWIDTHPTEPLKPDWTCTIKAIILESQPGTIRALEGVDLLDYKQVEQALGIKADEWVRYRKM